MEKQLRQGHWRGTQRNVALAVKDEREGTKAETTRLQVASVVSIQGWQPASLPPRSVAPRTSAHGHARRRMASTISKVEQRSNMVMSDHADTCEGQPWKWQGHRQDHLRKAQGHNPQGHGQGRLELHTLFVSKI